MAWTTRAVTLSITVLLHAVMIAGFLCGLRVGLPVPLHPAPHPSETIAPIIASIVSLDENNYIAASASVGPLNVDGLAATPARIDLPTPMPEWPSEEDEGTPPKAQSAPAAGRTGLHCEVHIHQSPAGRVQAIDFGECTGDVVWQHALLQTIERAAQLVAPIPEARYPPVRTLTVSTNNLSPVVLAQQLSSIERFENQTSSEDVHARGRDEISQ